MGYDTKAICVGAEYNADGDVGVPSERFPPCLSVSVRGLLTLPEISLAVTET